MRFVAIKELVKNASEVLDGLPEEGVIVTRDGKPAAALVHLDEELLEEYVLTHDPTLVKELKEARQEYLQEGGVDLKTVRRQLARRSRSRRKSATRD